MAGSIWQTNGGIYSGFRLNGNGEPDASREPYRYKGDRHYFLIGPTGSGKSRRSLLVNLVELTGWSALVLDVKGELCRMTARGRARAGNQIIIINPFDAFGLGSTGFNPIAALAVDDDFPDNALALAEAVIRIEGKEPHWAQAAQEWVAALIMYVRLAIRGGSFADVRALLGMDDARIRRLVLGGGDIDPGTYHQWRTSEPEDRDPDYTPPFEYDGNLYPGMLELAAASGWEEIGIKASRFGDITPDNREIHSVISTALTQTRWLDSRPIKRDLQGAALDFRVMKERPTTVYLILPARRLITHSSWLRLVVASVVMKLMEQLGTKVPVLFMLDEFAALAGGTGSQEAGDGFPAISNNMALFRGYGIKLWTVWQDLAQAKKIYGDPGYETFISNAGVLQSFAPLDVTTADYLSRRSGQTTVAYEGSSETRNLQPGTVGGVARSATSQTNIIQRPPLLPQDVWNMPEGHTVIYSQNSTGFVRSFFPDPRTLSHLREACALDPAS